MSVYRVRPKHNQSRRAILKLLTLQNLRAHYWREARVHDNGTIHNYLMFIIYIFRYLIVCLTYDVSPSNRLCVLIMDLSVYTDKDSGH